jgi:RNA polymerase sigma factor (sigma-70 family)
MNPDEAREAHHIATWWLCQDARRKRASMWAASEIGGGISDLVQQVMVELCRFPPPETVRISTAVCNQCRWTSSRLIARAKIRKAGDARHHEAYEHHQTYEGDQESVVLRAESRSVIFRMLRSLTYREREIIKLRYGLGDGYTYTLNDVAGVFRVTKERIRQIEKKAIHKLRHFTRSEELRPLHEDLTG